MAPAGAMGARLFRRRRETQLLSPTLLALTLAALFIAAVFANVGMGAVEIPPPQAVAILLSHAGIDVGVAFDARSDAVLWSIRLPRVVLAALVGGGLGVAGAALQGVFRNPLAEPAVIGVSGGAAAGAAGAIVLGLAASGPALIAAAAFLGGLTATGVVYFVARTYGRTEVVTLVLAGIAVNATASAVTGLLTSVADDDELRGITFWLLGSVGGATWPTVASTLPFFAAGLIALPLWGRSLNLMTLGDREAWRLGVSTERTRAAVIVFSALIAGAAVSVAGVISFVGLVVPHVIRLIAGPDHRFLLPASILGGATALLLADLLARTVAAPAEVPLGAVTALIGGPFFLWLVHRARKGWGGFA